MGVLSELIWWKSKRAVPHLRCSIDRFGGYSCGNLFCLRFWTCSLALGGHIHTCVHPSIHHALSPSNFITVNYRLPSTLLLKSSDSPSMPLPSFICTSLLNPQNQNPFRLPQPPYTARRASPPSRLHKLRASYQRFLLGSASLWTWSRHSLSRWGWSQR